MHIRMDKLRTTLSRRRVFFMGPGVSSIEKSGRSYPDDLQVQFMPDLHLEPYTTFWAGSGRSLISMGSFSYTHSVLPPSVNVGRYTSIALGLKVMGARHPHEWASTSPVFYNRQMMMATYERDHATLRNPSYYTYDYRPGPISIGNDVWIGENVTLGHGVTIGNGAIVASNSVVTRDVNPYTIVGGVPAKFIRHRFDTETMEVLLKSSWWDYSPDNFIDIDIRCPMEFGKKVLEMRKMNYLTPYRPNGLTADNLIEIL